MMNANSMDVLGEATLSQLETLAELMQIEDWQSLDRAELLAAVEARSVEARNWGDNLYVEYMT